MQATASAETAQTEKKDYADGFLGLFFIIAVILAMCSWSWLKSFYPLHPPQQFAVKFHDVAGLIPNSAVNVNGVRTGTVEKIELRGKNDVLVHIKINSAQVVVPEGSKFQILTNGVVGAKYIEIELPEVQAGAKLPPLDQSIVSEGQDPIRPELVINKVLVHINEMDLEQFHQKIEHDLDRLTETTDTLGRLSHKFEPVADHTLILETKLEGLTDDFRGTSQKINRLIGNPNLAADLKETADKAEKTAQDVRETMHNLNDTLTNQPLRQDIVTSLQNLNQSTEHVENAMKKFSEVTNNQKAREDIKDILVKARQTLAQADDLVNRPGGMGGDLVNTLQDTRKAVNHMDLVAQQMNQVLEKKHPLLHLLFGRPGHLAKKVRTVEKVTKPTGEQQQKVIVTDEKQLAN